ncbi:hypothetical protein ABW636_20740 [Aquimarina sp. 2201CG1-2-11]|uniref:hypothetical protein n=1 Tax=Aquimarina discodermiae TaxID=3231043 RepID=UPI0034630BE6
MKNIVLIFFLIFFLTVTAQNYLPYYKIINDAEIAYLDAKYQRSDSLYQKAFAMVPKPFKEDYLLAGINADKLQNTDKVYTYLKKGVVLGLTQKRIKKVTKKLPYFKKSKYYKILKTEYAVLREKHLNTLNIPLREEIIKMVKKDQAARAPIITGIRTTMRADNQNYKRLLEIIKNNNDRWPGFSDIGEITNGKYDVSKSSMLMPLHFQEEWVEVLRPYLFEAVMKGEMYPYHFARIYDYKFPTGDFCQIYGTYLNMPICNCDEANERRKKIGFEPLADYYRKQNIKYTCKE